MHTDADTSRSTPSTTPSATLYKSVCSGTVCPQILAAGTVGSPPSLSVFARGTDNGIWYTTAEASSLLPSWPSDKMWKNMGGGPFRSQPAAASWQLSSALSVVAVADPTGDVRLRTFDDSEWNSTWEDVKGQPVSAVSLCAVNLDRLDMWAAQSGIIVHNYFRPTADDFYAPSSSSTWQGEPTASSDGMTTRPAIACRNDTFIHDLMVYDNGTVQHSKWSPATGWTSPYKPFNDAYHFKSDPVLLATTNDRLDFFGIGTNGGMYHFSWESATSYSTMDDLGGSFESLPSAVATDDGKRIDVVALGSNGTLLHRVLQDTTWSPAWEDLGVVGNSAPLLLNVSSTQPEKVVAFVLGTHDEINQTTWTASSDISWKDLAWSSMGGSMSSAYFGQ